MSAAALAGMHDSHFRIVVALDLSEYAEIVLEHALDQAARHSSPDLHFLFVVDSDRDATVEAAKNRLARLVLEGLDTFGKRNIDWRSRLHVRAGKPHEEIVALAGELNAHLIVIGRFGARGRFGQLGSVAHRVIENSSCPTLAVNLVDQPIETQPQCPDCVQIRAETDGERWFCEAHSAPDRATLATTLVPPTGWIGGGPLW
jgi:nucleotide-binding universal stress UspA family protein